MRTTNSSLVGKLIHNLHHYARLSDDDREALESLRNSPCLETEARYDIVSEGDDPTVVRLMVSGWACRYKDLPDGRRQVVNFFVPGDFCDLNVHILQQMDHSIGALTRVRYLAIPPEKLHELTERRPRIAQALLWHELVNSSILREWLLNIGQRSARERLAHLFVEMYVRLRAVGLTRDHKCDWPITQNDIADATGLTSVHVNRTLQELRHDGLIELRAKQLHILDMERLKRTAMWNPNYLHLDHEGRELDAQG